MLHLIGRANASLPLFRRRIDYDYFRSLLSRFGHKHGLFIHHYVLMPTHFHFLVWMEKTEVLAAMMKGLALAYHHFYRRKYKLRGHLWHSRFRSIVIETRPQWLQCGRYIELNPVHDGICQDPEAYRWSSYHHFAHGRVDPLLRPIMHEDDVGETKDQIQETYRAFVRAGIDMDYHRLKRIFERESLFPPQRKPPRQPSSTSRSKNGGARDSVFTKSLQNDKKIKKLEGWKRPQRG